MKPLAWYERTDDEQRIATAQTFVWLSCAGSLYSLIVLLILSVAGHSDVGSQVIVHPLGVVLGLCLLALYLVTGSLIGARRTGGGLLGLALFGFALASHVWHGRLWSWPVAWSLLGIALILRAGRALRLPFVAPAS